MQRRLNLRLLFLMTLCVLLAAGQVAKDPRPSFLRPGLRMMAYVSNSGDGTVSVVDLVRLLTVATVTVGPSPSGIRAHPFRNEIWGVSTALGQVWVLDTENNAVKARVPVGGTPLAVDFSPDGNRAFVAAAGTRTLYAIDCRTHAVVAQARTGRRPWLARVSPDARLVVVPNREDSTLSVFEASNLRLLATLNVGPHPEQVVILPDSSKAFVTTAGNGGISVVDLRRFVLLTNIPLAGSPTDLILKSDGGELYVPVPSTNGIAILNTWANEFAQHLVLGTAPWRGSITHSSEPMVLFVSDAAAGRVRPVEIEVRLPRNTIPSGQRPGTSRLTPGEELLLVVNEDSNDLAVIRTRDYSLLTLIPVGSRPTDITIKVF